LLHQLDFVYALYIAMILLNLIVIVFLIFSTNLLTKIIRVPTRFLGLIILTLSFVGVYSLRNSMTDCIIAALFGVIGFALKRLSLPVVPIILGMVLGGIMEVKLRAGMARVKEPLDFIDRPIAFILFLMIVGVLILHVRRVLAERREIKAEKFANKHASTNFGFYLKNRQTRIMNTRSKSVRRSHLRYSRRDK